MIRPAADETTTRPRRATAGPSSHVIRRRWTGFVCEVNEELAVAAPARPSGRDGVMACDHATRRGGGGCWKVLELPFIQHVLTASTVMYDQKLSTLSNRALRLRAWADSQAIAYWGRS